MRIMKITIIFALLVSGASYLLMWQPWDSQTMAEVGFNTTNSSFDEFLSVNSVRENRTNWLKDQYQVSPNHRLFGMDAMHFSGEEVLKGKWKRHFIVDLTVPHDEYPNDRMGFNPSKGAGGFDFDNFLLNMKQNGLNSIPVVKGNLLYTDVEHDTLIHQHQLPWDTGGNRENPLDYKAYSSMLYQFVARYGSNRLIQDGGTIDPSMLKVDEKNAPLAGLNLIEAIEPGNEMDRDWFSKREEATPRDLAAFLSAAIDGHMGQMGPGHGIRNADPDMKILLPGLIDVKPDYLLEVKKELLALRKDASKYGYPVNPLTNFVINVHKYPWWDQPWKSPDGRPAVEQTDMFQTSVEFVRMVRREFPGCEIYMTESGYDKVIAKDAKRGVPTLPDDPVLEKGISPFAQARHTARLSLIMYGTGYDRFYLFTLKDPKAIGAGFYRVQFSTSGLVRKNGDKDLAWYVVRGLRSKLYGYHLENYEIEESLHKMTFTKDGSPQIQAIWLGTNNAEEREISVNSDGKGTMKIYRLADSDKPEWHNGEEVEGNTMTFVATEFPVLIEL